ncbi:Protein phosphatase 2C 6, partial [Desmophyllum pertusum]
ISVLVEGSSSSHVKSFQNYRKSKGKECKGRVSKSDRAKKRKEDVVINIGLLEWKKDNGGLKPKRGKKLALRTSPLVTYSVLRKDAEERWKNFHSNLYNSKESYRLLYEDGTRALFLPGSQTEIFTLKRYQEEIRKDFKRITLFLCTEHDLMKISRTG